MTANNYSDRTFIVMWCSEGLECVVDITSIERKNSWAILKGEPTTALPNLNAMVLRARYNSQRSYEIYLVTAVPEITEQDIAEMFENSPQEAADLIRERGRQIYSDRANKSKVVIV
jgi:hypothetical protein